MNSYQNQTFRMIKDARADRVVADIQLEACVIDNCLLSEHQANGSRLTPVEVLETLGRSADLETGVIVLTPF